MKVRVVHAPYRVVHAALVSVHGHLVARSSRGVAEHGAQYLQQKNNTVGGSSSEESPQGTEICEIFLCCSQ